MDDLLVQAYLWVATATSVAAAAWVAKEKLGVAFGGSAGSAAAARPEGGGAARRAPARRAEAERGDGRDARDAGGDARFASAGSLRQSLDGTPPSAASATRRTPLTPSSVRFADDVEFSPAATDDADEGGEAPEELLVTVVEHLDHTRADALNTFYRYDSAGSGALSVAQLCAVLRELGLRVDQGEVRSLVEHMGLLSGEQRNSVAIKGFLKGLKHARNQRARAAAEAEAEAEVQAAAAEAAANERRRAESDALAAEAPQLSAELGKLDEEGEEGEEGEAGPVSAWSAATNRDGMRVRPRSAGRAVRTLPWPVPFAVSDAGCGLVAAAALAGDG